MPSLFGVRFVPSSVGSSSASAGSVAAPLGEGDVVAAEIRHERARYEKERRPATADSF